MFSALFFHGEVDSVLKRFVIKYARLVLPGYCPICENSVVFSAFAGRGKVLCPQCKSLERHRAIFIWLRRFGAWSSANITKLLHIAPEECLGSFFSRQKNIDYLSADLHSPYAMLQINMTEMPLESNSFHAIICSHVMEHITDDRRAIREMFRVLKPGGFAIVSVPLSRGATYEDFTLTSDEERLAAFGQTDHVRICGRDYPSRFQEAGFRIETIIPSRAFGYLEALRTRTESETFFVCRKES